MKSIRLYIILFLFGLLTGCFEDEGNYSYEEINPPLWSDNFNTSSPKRMSGYAGDGEVMKFRAVKCSRGKQIRQCVQKRCVMNGKSKEW